MKIPKFQFKILKKYIFFRAVFYPNTIMVKSSLTIMIGHVIRVDINCYLTSRPSVLSRARERGIEPPCTKLYKYLFLSTVRSFLRIQMKTNTKYFS